MKPIKFVTPTEQEAGDEAEANKKKLGEAVETNKNDAEWYDYGTTTTTKKWANAQTKDDSMWVWIPRYAYKITYYTDENKTTVSEDITQYGKVDIRFLIGKTNYYYDDNGEMKEAKRAEAGNEIVDTIQDYTVHPAFTNESTVGFANGGWDEELSGIWVAKFEAGYASSNNKAPVKASSVSYEGEDLNSVYVSKVENGTDSNDWKVGRRNWLDGIYGATETKIKYPTFQPLAYSMNYLTISDAFKISRALTESDNIYGLSNTDADSHLMKNSEWGAVAYLTQSQYGRNGEEVAVNNATLNSGSRERTEVAGKSEVDSAYAVTGMTSNSTTDGEIKVTQSQINDVLKGNSLDANGCYLWNQVQGQNASTTGTIYGIYDLSGGLWERTTSFISNGNENLLRFGKAIMNSAGISGNQVAANTGANSKYVTIYSPHSDTVNPGSDNEDNGRSQSNFKTFIQSSNMYGDAIKETTTDAAGKTGSTWDSSSWNNDASIFPEASGPFFLRGGSWSYGEQSGNFTFGRISGAPAYSSGFRPVLVTTVSN